MVRLTLSPCRGEPGPPLTVNAYLPPKGAAIRPVNAPSGPVRPWASLKSNTSSAVSKTMGRFAKGRPAASRANTENAVESLPTSVSSSTRNVSAPASFATVRSFRLAPLLTGVLVAAGRVKPGGEVGDGAPLPPPPPPQPFANHSAPIASAIHVRCSLPGVITPSPLVPPCQPHWVGCCKDRHSSTELQQSWPVSQLQKLSKVTV